MERRKFFGRVMFCWLLFICLVLTHHILLHYCSKFCFISWLQFQVIDKDKRNNNNCLYRMENICKCTRHNFSLSLALLCLTTQFILFEATDNHHVCIKCKKDNNDDSSSSKQQKNLQNIQKLLKLREKKQANWNKIPHLTNSLISIKSIHNNIEIV